MSNPNDQLIAEVISIGDEMTSGARLDTNGQWLSRRLGELGIQVAYHTTVGDTLSHNVDVFRCASERADIVITTGGLGPTRDDLTREVLSELVNEPLELRQDALNHILELFSKRNRVMPERNQVQAMFPRGSQQIHNPEGSAPGIDITLNPKNRDSSRIFALPGVPAEMKRMFDDTVSGRIMEQTRGDAVIRHHVMKFFGTGESDMELRLGEMISRDRQPRVGITVSKATISLRITATADSISACEEQISSTRSEILERVEEFFFGEGETFEQQHAILESLTNQKETLTIIELGRSALLGDWFAESADVSHYRGGISMADLEQLDSFICTHVTNPIIEVSDRGPKAKSGDSQNPPNSGPQNTCTKEKPESIAKKARHFFGSDWLLLVNEYPSLTQSQAGPLPAQEVNFLVVTPDGTVFSEQQSMGGHPDVIQPRIAKAAMQFLRKQLSTALRTDEPAAIKGAER